MKREILIAALAVVAVGEIATAANETGTLLVSGKVEAVNVQAKSITVNGKTFQSKDSARFIIGQYVNVYGKSGAASFTNQIAVESAASYGSESLAGSGTNTAGGTAAAERAVALTQTGERAEALTQTGERSEALTQTGERAEALTQTGERAEALTQTGESGE
jgi:hypothetical protein